MLYRYIFKNDRFIGTIKVDSSAQNYTKDVPMTFESKNGTLWGSSFYYDEESNKMIAGVYVFVDRRFKQIIIIDRDNMNCSFPAENKVQAVDTANVVMSKFGFSY